MGQAPGLRSRHLDVRRLGRQARRVQMALAALPSEQRAPLELVYYRNRTQAEAAAQLGVPLGTLKSRLSLGIRRMHALLAVPEVAS